MKFNLVPRAQVTVEKEQAYDVHCEPYAPRNKNELRVVHFLDFDEPTSLKLLANVHCMVVRLTV